MVSLQRFVDGGLQFVVAAFPKMLDKGVAKRQDRNMMFEEPSKSTGGRSPFVDPNLYMKALAWQIFSEEKGFLAESFQAW